MLFIKVLETVNFEEKFSSLPEFDPLACSPAATNMTVYASSPSGTNVTVYTSSTMHKEDDIGSDATATPRYIQRFYIQDGKSQNIFFLA